METNGVVVRAERLVGRPWAVVSLGLVFELPDGRLTAPYHVSGTSLIDQFLRRFGARTPEDLVGVAMSLQVAVTGAEHPAVVRVGLRSTHVPESIRRAFNGDDLPSSPGLN